MSCKNYRVLEMHNSAIGAVAVGAFMPLGKVTRRISECAGSGVPFEITNSGADTIQLTSKGYYKVLYTASVVTGGAGTVTLQLMENGTAVASATATATAAGTLNVVIAKEIRVFANCQSCPTNCPVDLQVLLSGTAITGGSSNIIVDSCVNG